MIYSLILAQNGQADAGQTEVARFSGQNGGLAKVDAAVIPTTSPGCTQAQKGF
jgi:hypothetical protein